MNKRKILFASLLVFLTGIAQACKNDFQEPAENSQKQFDIAQPNRERYKLYQTENIFTLLQLDTETGMIEQVQWSLDSKEEGSITINSENLTNGEGNGVGSFELYPTKNMYQFILIDKINGTKWHVQWGLKDDMRWIRRIIKKIP